MLEGHHGEPFVGTGHLHQMALSGEQIAQALGLSMQVINTTLGRGGN